MTESWRLALVAMPWSKKERPSAAIAALSAFARQTHPAWQVTPKSAFLSVYAQLGAACYDAVAGDAYEMGELLYAALLYPERRASVAERFEAWSRARPVAPGRSFEQVMAVLEQHVEQVAEWAAGADLLGLTTCFGQLFANLALARAVKRSNPACTIVLGGSTLSSRVGPSVLEEYPMVDAIVQGEGEAPLAALMTALETGRALGSASVAVLTRAGAAAPAACAVAPEPARALHELRQLDELPYPDYDEYADAAAANGVAWALPIEGSRGCYWDRTKKANDPKATCYFCNLNVQWGGYRQKSVERIVRELEQAALRHQNVHAYFVDNILRRTEVEELAAALCRAGMEFDVFLEMRAHVSPHDVLVLWEAGLTRTQFGIEALSTEHLARIGKGTTLLQNLQAMRSCAEFGISHGANLLTSFPGTPQSEVEESARVIRTHARGYEPLTLSRFHLGVGSTVDCLPDAFGVRGIRNADFYRCGLPDPVWQRLQLFDLDYDVVGEAADWGPVKRAVAEWNAFHQQRASELPAIRYRDGGSFVVVEDERFGSLRHGTFEGILREVLLECCEIRTLAHVQQLVESHGGTPEDATTILDHFIANGIMVAEKQKYLSLPVATSPRHAARRIRERQAKREARQPRPRSLPLVG